MKKVVWVCDFCGTEQEWCYRVSVNRTGKDDPAPSIQQYEADAHSLKCAFRLIKAKGEQVEGT